LIVLFRMKIGFAAEQRIGPVLIVKLAESQHNR
jgi:hypothetical protein